MEETNREREASSSRERERRRRHGQNLFKTKRLVGKKWAFSHVPMFPCSHVAGQLEVSRCGAYVMELRNI
jgi:hypothetical protein